MKVQHVAYKLIIGLSSRNLHYFPTQNPIFNLKGMVPILLTGFANQSKENVELQMRKDQKVKTPVVEIEGVVNQVSWELVL